MTQEYIQIQDQRDFWWVCLDICVMQDPDIPLSAKGIYAVLCTFASQRGDRTCFPKVATIAKTAGCCPRTVQTALNHLEAKGYIRRQARYKNEGLQSSSEYQIVGHRAARMERPESRSANIAEPDRGANIADRPLQNLQTRTIATLTTKEPTPSEGASAPAGPEEVAEREDLSCSPEDVPEVMRPTAELLMLKTGRKGLSPGEVSAFRALEKAHTPARVQKELLTAEERFRRRGRPLEELTAEYLLESLKHQTSRRGKGKAKGGRGNARNGDSGGSHEKLPDQYNSWWEDQKRAASVSGAGLEPLPGTGGEAGPKS